MIQFASTEEQSTCTCHYFSDFGPTYKSLFYVNERPINLVLQLFRSYKDHPEIGTGGRPPPIPPEK